MNNGEAHAAELMWITRHGRDVDVAWLLVGVMVLSRERKKRQ